MLHRAQLLHSTQVLRSCSILDERLIWRICLLNERRDGTFLKLVTSWFQLVRNWFVHSSFCNKVAPRMTLLFGPGSCCDDPWADGLPGYQRFVLWGWELGVGVVCKYYRLPRPLPWICTATSSVWCSQPRLWVCDSYQGTLRMWLLPGGTHLVWHRHSGW